MKVWIVFRDYSYSGGLELVGVYSTEDNARNASSSLLFKSLFEVVIKEVELDYTDL